MVNKPNCNLKICFQEMIKLYLSLRYKKNSKDVCYQVSVGKMMKIIVFGKTPEIR